MTAGYLLKQLVAWVTDFFRHWYVEGAFFISKALMATLSGLDRVLALRVNVKNIFRPMYQDNSFIGYAFGFIFRSARIIIALTAYIFVSAVFLSVYLIWAAIPPYLIIKALNINAANLF